jgi:hypothetical protein
VTVSLDGSNAPGAGRARRTSLGDSHRYCARSLRYMAHCAPPEMPEAGVERKTPESFGFTRQPVSPQIPDVYVLWIPGVRLP